MISCDDVPTVRFTRLFVLKRTVGSPPNRDIGVAFVVNYATDQRLLAQ
jgi:hypothetical protein